MSASLAALAGQATTIYSAASLLFGGAGSVKLGGVTFQGIEVPEVIKWGAKQDIVKQRIPGNSITLNAMGLDFHPIAWSGIFEGLDAVSRSREIYGMLNSAALVALAWNDRSYTVLVESYEADDTKTNWIPYHVSCIVLRDETLSDHPPAPSLLSRVTADIADAIGITPAQLTQGVGTALTAAQQAATVIGAVTAGSGAALALTGAVAGAVGVVSGLTSLANSQIANVAAGALSGGGILAAGSALSGIANLGSAVSAAATLSVTPVISGLLGRVQTNMANAST